MIEQVIWVSPHLTDELFDNRTIFDQPMGEKRLVHGMLCLNCRLSGMLMTMTVLCQWMENHQELKTTRAFCNFDDAYWGNPHLCLSLTPW